MKKHVKNAQNYECKICDFKCCRKTNWDSHILTNKHKFRTNPNILEQKKESLEFKCKYCQKKYKARNSLWYHEKKCLNIFEYDKLELNNDILDQKFIKPQTDDDVKELVLQVINENKQLHKIILEMIPKIGNNSTVNNNNTNSHNKTFNLNVFLNETCKDAMNIMDFANSLKIKLSDLENVGKLGYVDGITSIIAKNLKELDITKRPVHCSDIKREILYVKDQDKWEKENDDKERLKLAIKHIAHKNIQMIPEWKKENPEYKRDEGKANDQYLKIVMESMGGSDKQEDDVYQNKIISKLAKHVTIAKDSK